MVCSCQAIAVAKIDVCAGIMKSRCRGCQACPTSDVRVNAIGHHSSFNLHNPITFANMKLSLSFIVSSLLGAVSASKVGHVYTYDPIANASPQPPSSSSVTPDTARLIFAQRLGLSRFHSIRHASEGDIQQINAYGGRPQKLFGEDRERTQARILVWVEDVEDVAG